MIIVQPCVHRKLRLRERFINDECYVMHELLDPRIHDGTYGRILMTEGCRFMLCRHPETYRYDMYDTKEYAEDIVTSLQIQGAYGHMDSNGRAFPTPLQQQVNVCSVLLIIACPDAN